MELFTPGHLLIVAIVAFVLFFGWKQLPDMSRSLGRSLRVFKTEIKGLSEDDKARDEHARRAGRARGARGAARGNSSSRRPPSRSRRRATRPRPAPRPRA